MGGGCGCDDKAVVAFCCYTIVTADGKLLLLQMVSYCYCRW